jgi:hypothetical protein
MTWSLLLIAWASVLVYDLSSPGGPILAKRDPQPLITDKAIARHPGHRKPFRRG